MIMINGMTDFLKALLGFLILICTGCSTIFNIGSQSVRIEAEDNQEIQIQIQTVDGEILNKKTPFKLKINPSTLSKTKIAVKEECYGQSFRSIPEEMHGSFLFNLNYFFAPIALIDLMNGQMWSYPETYQIQLTPLENENCTVQNTSLGLKKDTIPTKTTEEKNEKTIQIFDRDIRGKGGIYVGITVREDRIFVFPLDDDDGAPSMSGDLFNGFGVEPKIGYQNAFHHFQNSNFGYLIFTEASPFKVNRQAIPLGRYSLFDLGTSISGYRASFTPLLVYGYETPDMFFYIGTGLGIGYLYAKGNAYMTHGKVSPECENAVKNTNELLIKQNCERKNVDVNNFGSNLVGTISLTYKNFMFKLSGSAPYVEDLENDVGVVSNSVESDFMYLFRF